MNDVVHNHIGGVFLPVSNIEAARDWYCALLSLERGEIQFGHIYVVPMRAGSNLVLDSKDFRGPHDRKPAFHFMTRDIRSAYSYMKEKGVQLAGDIVDGVFFNFKDPDGNLLMVADVPLTQGG